MSTLRLAEREGIGVDRMVRDMLAVGRPDPEITELPGSYVRVGLIGGEPDPEILALLDAASPPTLAADVDALLVIDHLSRRGWIDIDRAAPILQRPPTETAAALDRIAGVAIDGKPLLVQITGVPASHPPAWRLGDTAQAKLASRAGRSRSPGARDGLVVGWARARGRVSSTEVADLLGLSVPSSGGILAALEEQGLLAGGREQKLGRGFYYVPVSEL